MYLTTIYWLYLQSQVFKVSSCSKIFRLLWYFRRQLHNADADPQLLMLFMWVSKILELLRGSFVSYCICTYIRVMVVHVFHDY